MYSFNSRVRYSECDNQGCMTVLSMINYLQDCSTFQSEALGVGVEFMKARSRAWFLAAWNIHIIELPRFGDEIVISTWPYEFRGIYGRRNFTITGQAAEGQQGKRFVQADSLWFLMDLQAGRPVRPAPEEISGYLSSGGARIPDLPPMERKLTVPAGTEGLLYEAPAVRILPHHLDTNLHVNNAQYIEIAREAMDEEVELHRLDAQYKKQAHLGDELRPVFFRTENGFIADLRDEAGESCAVVRVS